MLPLHLAVSVVHAYDRVVVETIHTATTAYSFSGRLAVYRILQDHAWLLFEDVAVYPEEDVTRRRPITTITCDSMLLRCYNPHADVSYVPVTEQVTCPYTTCVTRKVKAVKKKMPRKGKKEAIPEGAYNPAQHATSLGDKEEAKGGSADWRRPQPYNEKLRRVKTDADRQALASTQVGVVDVLKGKYRKRAVEYPHK